MTKLQKIAVGVALIVLIGAGALQSTRIERLRGERDALQRQIDLLAKQLEQATRDSDAATGKLAALGAGSLRDTGELMRLRGEVGQLRRQLVANAGTNGVATSATGLDSARLILAEQTGRELGLAVVRGEPGAFDKFVELAKTAYADFHLNSDGLNDSLRGDLARRTFAPLNAAFKALEEAVAGGNRDAILAIARALQVPDLKGGAVSSLGVLAGQANEAALVMLLNPDQHGLLLLSSSLSALQPAVEAGNQRAIDAFAAVAGESKNQALWMLAADGLAKPAAAGNSVAIDALVRLSASTNDNVRRSVASALQRVDVARNPSVADALRAVRAP